MSLKHCLYTVTCCPLHAAAPALLEALLDASRIVGKVVADDLMPDIAAPGFPKLVLERINAALALAEDGAK